MQPKNKTILHAVRRLYKILSKKRRYQFWLLMLLMILSSFVEAISISSIIPFLGALIAPENLIKISLLNKIINYFGIIEQSDLRLVFTLFFIFMVLVSTAFRVIFFLMQTHISMAIGIEFSSNVYQNILHQSYPEIIDRNSSEILADVQKAKELVGTLVQPILTFLSSIFILLAVVGTIFAIEPKIAMISIFSLGSIYMIVSLFTRRLLEINSKTYAIEIGLANRAVQEGIGGIRDVIIEKMQSNYVALYRSSLTRLQAAAASNLLISQMPRFLIEMLGLVSLALAAFLMFKDENNFLMVLPFLGMIALGAQKLLPILQQAYSAYSSMRGGIASTFDALNLLDQIPTQEVSGICTNKFIFNNKLVIDGVSFGYPGQKQKIFNKINLEIKKGSCIGIVGPTGCGKSTLVDLIMGLLVPINGSISVDNQRLCESSVKEWHAVISHVPQNIYLADTSIAENIAFGVEYSMIDWGRLNLALKISQLTAVVENLPEGNKTKVGERGVRLSVGQRQRVGIARAIYKKSKVLILDEATSALDSDTESRVMRGINELDGAITTIIIAHRVNTLRNCDRILEICNGGINWTGNYSEFEIMKGHKASQWQ